MTWLAPWALAAGLLLAGPVLVHMLLRRHARRVVFPAAHFLTAARASSVRLRRPSDVWLLALRLLIVAAAVAAAARPLVLAPWRIAQWDARISRAVVLDTSRGMSSPDIGAALAQQEMAAAFHAQRFAGADLRSGIARAAAWLADAPPSRREIVVLSDFQQGSLDARALAAIPPDAGVRLIRAGAQPPARAVALPVVDGWRGARWQPDLSIAGDSTRASWTRVQEVAPPAWLTAVAAPDETAAAARALRAAASFGIAAGDDRRRAIVVFAGGNLQGSAPQPVRTPWMVPAVLALRDSRLLRESGTSVTAGELDGVLVVEPRVAAASTAAPAVVRAVILAVRPASIADAEEETITLPDAQLAAWARPAAPVTDRRGIAVDEGDARWLWAAALLLLLLEGWARRTSRPAAAQEKDVVHADAA